MHKRVAPILYLPSGSHRVTVNTGDGTVIASDAVTVGDPI